MFIPESCLIKHTNNGKTYVVFKLGVNDMINIYRRSLLLLHCLSIYHEDGLSQSRLINGQFQDPGEDDVKYRTVSISSIE